MEREIDGKILNCGRQFLSFKATINHKKSAPDSTLTKANVIGPVAPSNSAQRFRIELAENANNARNVSIYNRII